MKRAFVASSVLALVSAFVACGGEKIIVVHDGAAPQNAKATSTDAPIATTATDAANSGDDSEWGIRERTADVEYQRTIAKVAGMASDSDLASRVQRRNLSLVNVMWEDTGRAEGSALGPNISDVTLQVRRRAEQGQFETTLMPVIRPPNFVDRTGDVAADKFFVRVGNQNATGDLTTVPLTDLLRDVRHYVSVPEDILGSGNLLAARDSHFLVSAQAVFLPIPKSGKAEFNPAIFNYQSAPGSPAVLSILVTRQGTSVSVIENRPQDSAGGGYGQKLYFNNHGQRAALTAERKSEVEARITAQGGPKNDDDKSALQKGADVMFLIQVPLIHKNRGALGGAMPMPVPTAAAAPAGNAAPPAPAKAAMAEEDRDGVSDVEQAVLGHGANLGPFNEAHHMRLVRDPQFPVRVTVQFYKATSNGVVSDVDLDGISRSIGSVYEHADFVGSLVIPEGDPRRPTSWQTIPHEWFPW